MKKQTKDLMKLSKKEIIKHFRQEHTILKSWMFRYQNRIKLKNYQLKNYRIKMKRIIKSLEYMVKHPYSVSQTYKK